MSYSIDEIMDMLDWNNSFNVQNKGIELSKDIRCINVFLQPMHKDHNKNVWDNCATILSKRRDDELRPYLFQLFEWLEDFNWPGAYCILDRLNSFEKDKHFIFVYEMCVNKAKQLNNSNWLNGLMQINVQY